ncbi:wall-associated receptor kinase-like 20 [Phoenix dactylifera]|uniref:Wall-associated receptor kinase-like 20 n=1 Tax=Phoenix dactylifera TaxID=42345 RepID=A0A8B7CDY5_PHODC|nr:wall-associated receptor kinase-like 20 [Phoenix dactylifera]
MAATLSLLALAILATLAGASSRDCPPCGGTEIPYPLSTSSNCGDPDYKLYCNNNSLEFLSVGGTPHPVLSINPEAYRLIIHVPAIDMNVCSSSDLFEGGLKIDESSPFNISNRNTVMLFDCNETILFSPLNCSSNSLCRKFEETEEGSACRDTLCCTYLKDSRMTSHRIRIRVGGCTAYTSVVDIDPNDPPSLWNFGIELQWLPRRT